MQVLIATRNKAKIKLLNNILEGLDISLITLDDLNIYDTVEETKDNPKDNAILKANFYSKYYDRVICHDCGLYFVDFHIDDPIQPKVLVRRVDNKSLTDKEMIDYYKNIAKDNGGRIKATYLNAYSVVKNNNIYTYFDSLENNNTEFYICDKEINDYNEGFPIDSISLDINKDYNEYYSNIREFFKEVLLNN